MMDPAAGSQPSRAPRCSLTEYRLAAQGVSYRTFLLCNRSLPLPFMFNRSNLILPLVGVCLTIALSNGADAQEAPTPPPAARISAENPNSFDPATATQAWLDTVPADERAKSDAYFEGG